jgi:nucleolar protein 15
MLIEVSCLQNVPGVIYLGRVPHGFYEHEMRAYFTQFGNVTRLRLSRNKTTGKSKHYAFIEFDDADVAQIVADTMNNYLLFGHILKCKVVPRDNLEYIEKLFKGANKRYKPRPVSKLAKAELEKKRTEETWEKLVKKENNKRKSLSKRLQAKGIDYEFEAPVAKKAKKEEQAKEITTIEPEAVAVATVAPADDSAEDTITVASVVPKEKAPAKKSKAKKAKKSKA